VGAWIGKRFLGADPENEASVLSTPLGDAQKTKGEGRKETVDSGNVAEQKGKKNSMRTESSLNKKPEPKGRVVQKCRESS